MNGCYKGLREGERCGYHPDGCPETLTPEQRADAFINANNAGLAMWSPCMFRRRLIETIQAAQEQGKNGESEEPRCTCLPAGLAHDHSDDCELEKWRQERERLRKERRNA